MFGTAKHVPTRQQLLFDIFITALEGGIGYWSHCTQYHWMRKDAPKGFGATSPFYDPYTSELSYLVNINGDDGRFTNEDVDGFFAVIVDEDEKQYRVDAKVIEVGLARFADPAFNVNKDIRGAVLTAAATNEADIDAEVADHIVQAALFGDIIYG